MREGVSSPSQEGCKQGLDHTDCIYVGGLRKRRAIVLHRVRWSSERVSTGPSAYLHTRHCSKSFVRIPWILPTALRGGSTTIQHYR